MVRCGLKIPDLLRQLSIVLPVNSPRFGPLSAEFALRVQRDNNPNRTGFLFDLEDMNEVDELLLNAELRNELDRYYDESLVVIDTQRMSTHFENEYLSSILAWERAPSLPISQWFEPAIGLPPHDTLSDVDLHQRLQQTLRQLYDRNILLDFTGHLSDRQLYCLIRPRHLAGTREKVAIANTFLHWQCIDPMVEEENWLRFYADDEERREWQAETGLALPPLEELPFPRAIPRRRPVDDKSWGPFDSFLPRL